MDLLVQEYLVEMEVPIPEVEDVVFQVPKVVGEEEEV
jgi:hypothetical protein